MVSGGGLLKRAYGVLCSALVLVTPLACGAGEGGTEVITRCAVSGGRGSSPEETVSSEFAPDDVETWRVDEVLSLGTARGDTTQQFGLISDVEIDGSGRLYVADVHARRILVFRRDGTRIRSLGREGEGPGEFAGVLEVAVTSGDSVRVFDLRLWRETVFDRGGEWVRTDALPQPPQFGQIPEIDFDGHGNLYNLGYGQFASSLRSALRRGSEPVRGTVTIDVWSSSAESWRTLARVPGMEVLFSGGGLQDAPFAARPLWDPAPGAGVWYADSREYRLVRLSLSGDTLCRIDVEMEAPEVSAQDESAYLNAEDVDGVSDERMDVIRTRRRHMPLPDRRPVIRSVVASTNGGVWVRRSPQTWGAEPDTVAWDVWSGAGELVAQARLPGSLQPESVGPDVVLGVRRTEEDVGQLVVYEIAE